MIEQTKISNVPTSISIQPMLKKVLNSYNMNSLTKTFNRGKQKWIII